MDADQTDSAADVELVHESPGGRRGGDSVFPWRGLVVGLLLIPPNAYWVAQMERARQTAFPTVFSLFFNTIFALIVLTALNRLVRWLAPRLALRHAELLLVYSMLCVSTGIAGIDFIQTLMPVFTWSFHAASPANHWDDRLNPLLPKWLTVGDPVIYRPFYEGGGGLYRPHVLAAWAGPVALWTLFIVALLLVMLCICSILRRRWLEQEHLSCPLATFPLDIVDSRAGLFHNRLFWTGFALAASLEIWNSFAFWYPALPPVQLTEMRLFENLRPPWHALGTINRSFYPFLIGIGFMMPLDFLFSCWFFYLFWLAELVASSALGLDRIPEFPFAVEQGFGAYLLFALYGVWLGRGYFRQAWERVVRPERRCGVEREALSYRGAAVGLALGLVFLVWFNSAMGMSVAASLGVFVLYFILSVSLTRMRAQFGTPIHDLHFTEPSRLLVNAFGAQTFSVADRVGLAINTWYNTIYRSHPMPHQMEALYMQSKEAGGNRGTVIALMLAGLVGALATFWAFLHIYYNLGMGARALSFNPWVIQRLDDWVLNPRGPRWETLPASGAGLLVALLLQTMRMRYVNWPFHPLGFAISGNIQMGHAFMPLLVAWLLKVTVVKYWGHKAYVRVAPVFVGFVLADFVVISILNIVSISLHIPCYRFVD